ncbi:MAG TPA: DMT family transporter [Pyrinomonadaceae bacterium]|jgi:drug/metabolite transporter (DMT)-like permease
MNEKEHKDRSDAFVHRSAFSVRRLASPPPILFAFGAALLWSTGGLFIKATSLSALELSFGRSVLAALTVAWFTRREGFGLNLVTGGAAVMYAALLLLFVMATKLTTAANAIFLQYTAPVYIMFFEPLLYREKFRVRDLGVVVACVAGMSLFFVGKLRPQDVEGNLTALASGLCFACFALLLRHPATRRVNRASSVIYGNLLLALVAAPAFLTGGLQKMSPKELLIILFLGVVQIGLAYTLFTLSIARGVRSLDAGVVGYIEPVLNPVWVFIFLGERPSAWAILGGSIIVAAVVAHMLVQAKKRELPPSLS